MLQRKLYGGERGNEQSQLEALPCQYSVLEALMMCVKQGWMSILVSKWDLSWFSMVDNELF